MAEVQLGFAAKLKRDLLALGDSPRELWIVYGIKFLESVAYFAVYNLLQVYLSEDLRYGDVEAGSIMGVWLTAVSVVMFFSGFVADSLGIRRSLLISIASCVVGRALVTFAESRGVALTGLFLMTWGIASMLPTMTAGVRRYTSTTTVAFGFSLFYVIMNLGAFVAARVVGAFRRWFAEPETIALPGGITLNMTSSQLIFAVSLGVTILCVVLVALMRSDERVGGDAAAAAAKHENPLKIFSEVAVEKAFWRFMLFITLLVLVRLIFQHAHQTWPKYTLREFGKDFPFADYWSLNPLLIIFLTPIATAFTRERSAFGTIVVGSLITAFSVVFMIGSTTVAASIAFIVMLSVGEALWSPRLYEYTSTIAPKGREASYMGMSQVPMFFAKMTVGFMSGSLLASYCPQEGPRNSAMLWTVIFATTLAGPILILALRRVIEGRRAA